MARNSSIPTSELPTATPAGNREIWIRLPKRGPCPHTGLTRPFFYDLIKKGKIKTACLRKPGALRGVRLVWLPSVSAYVEKFASGGTAN